MAGDLLPKLRISTKVGFFSGHGRPEHSLDPDRLVRALNQTNADLGRAPDLVFLHNPERSLERAPERARNDFAEACGALQDAATRGLCGDWGVASWNPSPVSEVIDPTTPKPSVLMIRSGLLVGIDALDAAEALTGRWKPSEVWGMSPFGGDAGAAVWDTVDPRLFLQGRDDECSRPQAAFRAAYGLPPVEAVAVGTDNPTHLSELLDALRYEIDVAVIHQYRTLLRGRARRQPV